MIGIGAVLRFTANAMPRRTAAGALEAARWQAYARHLKRLGPGAWPKELPENTLPSGRRRARRDEDTPDDVSVQAERALPYAVALGFGGDWVQRFATAGATPRFIQSTGMGGGPGWGGGMYGPWIGGGGYGGGRGGGHRGGGAASGGPTDEGGTPVVGNNPLERGSNSLADLLNAASEVLGKGGGGGWSGGGSGGGSFSGGGGGGGGGGSSFE